MSFDFTTHDGQTLKWPLAVTPREVQLEALSKGFGKEGFAYFLRQRLGKTWLAYAEFVLLRQQDKVDWFFLICPNSLKDQWKEAITEVDEFIPLRIYESNNKAKTWHFFDKNKKGGVFIINYESVQSFLDSDGLLKFSPERTFIVADESTKIKEPKSKMSKACIGLAKQCSYKRVLTGKPTANSNADLWAQLSFINATQRNFYQHKFNFCIMGGFQGRQFMKNINEDYLKREMAPYIYIAPDKYIKGFEKVYEPMRRIVMQPEQAQQYRDMEDALILELGDIKITAPIALVKYLRLQQISSGVAGDIDGTQHNTIEPERNPKIRNVIEILENEISNKCIIVCRFTLSIKNLYKVLTDKGYNCRVMTGSQSDDLNQMAKWDFQNNEMVDVLIAQIQILSYGHTLCGPEDRPCDSIIYYENDFSLINRMQSESRPEKMGRDIPISIYDMYASKMDRYILESLRKKEDASMSIMGYCREYGFRPKGVAEDTIDLGL